MLNKPDEIKTIVALNDEQAIIGYGMIRKTMSGDWYLGPLQSDNE